jgi:cation diffusion facilitator family transporter
MAGVQRAFGRHRNAPACLVTRSARLRSTRRTVLIAGSANLAVAVLKLVAGIIAGSSAMLAECAHSIADTINQGLLLTSLRLGERPGDRRHPFGYGQDRYFWSLLSAFGIFIAGAGFSVFEGVLALQGHRTAGSLVLAYVVIAASLAAEGTSLVRAARQTRAQAAERHARVLDHVRDSPDTTVKTALLEDCIAVAGLFLALGGLILRQLTGSEIWDGAASIAIGVLLVAVAIRLAADSRQLLIGQAADPAQQRLIRSEIEAAPGVEGVVELLTMHLGPERLIVGARLDLTDDITGEEVERLADHLDIRLAERLAVTPHVFLDPTHRRRAEFTPGDTGS